MGNATPNKNGFHLHIDKYNSAYLGFDRTHDAVRDATSAIVEKTDALSSADIGGHVEGVVNGAHAGLTRLRDGDPDAVHGALRSLQYRSAHLLNGMYDSLDAYNNADRTHAQGIRKAGDTISGQHSDPGHITRRSGSAAETVEHQRLAGVPATHSSGSGSSPGRAGNHSK